MEIAEELVSSGSPGTGFRQNSLNGGEGSGKSALLENTHDHLSASSSDHLAKLQDEVSVFLDELSSQKGAPYDPNSTLLASVSNNISTLIFGDRLPYDHPRRRFLNDFLHIVAKVASLLTVFSFVPILIKVCLFLKIKLVEDLKKAAHGTRRIFE